MKNQTVKLAIITNKHNNKTAETQKQAPIHTQNRTSNAPPSK